jgi:hypothetical protein
MRPVSGGLLLVAGMVRKVQIVFLFWLGSNRTAALLFGKAAALDVKK